MNDRSWMLSAKAIRTAKACISIVKKNHGDKLAFSDPQFMQKLAVYVRRSDSKVLLDAYRALLSMSRAGMDRSDTDKKVPRNGAKREVPSKDGVETVEFQGKYYPRWNDGKQFRGLYRGAPRYN